MDLSKIAPEIVLSFSDAADVPKALPVVPVLAGGSIPVAGDAMRFAGSDRLFVVIGRVFSYDDKGKGVITLNLARHQ